MSTDFKKSVEDKKELMSKELKFYTDYLEKKGIRILASDSYSRLISEFSGVLRYIYSDNIELLCNELLLSQNDRDIIIDDIVSYSDYRTVSVRILRSRSILALLNSKNINKTGKDILKTLFIYDFYLHGPLIVYDKTQSKITSSYGNITSDLEQLCEITIKILITHREQIKIFNELSYLLENNTFSEVDLKEKIQRASKELKLDYFE